MSVGVIVAVEHHLEAEMVTAIDASRSLEVVRRCADSAELLSTAAAGIADLAVVSPGFRGVDKEALRALAGLGVVVAGVIAAGDAEGEARLRQLGVVTVLVGGEGVTDLESLGEGRNGPPGWFPEGVDLDDLTDARPRSVALGGPDSDLQVLPGGRQGRVVAVWGPTGAPGRTTVATSLASVLASRGVSTLVIDLDTWGASVAQVLGLVDEAPALAAAARAAEHGTLDLVVLSRLSPEVSPRLRVITGLPAAHRWPEARAAAVEEIIGLARGLAQVVVLDCGFAIEDDEELSYDTAAPRRNAATLAALSESDEVLLVGAADPIGLQRLVRASAAIGSVPSPPPVVVVNKVRAGVAGPHPQRAINDVLGRFAGLDDLLFIPWAPEECDGALLAGRAVSELHPRGAVAHALERVADRLLPQSAAISARGRDRRRRWRRR
ncbi:MAG: hypothetical protein KBB39_12865 [Phycicoccus sp.]|nr:hypothetical protein [Phycicoccus sp.]